jgi:hypothetical protein
MIFINENETFYITPRSNDFNLLKITNESTGVVLLRDNFDVEVLDYGVKIGLQFLPGQELDNDTFYMLEVVNASIERIAENNDVRLTEDGFNRLIEDSIIEDSVVYRGKIFKTNQSKINYSVNKNNYITI